MLVLFLASMFATYIAEAADSIRPDKTTIFLTEGSNTILTCTYEGSAYSLQWYQQNPGSKPEFLLRIIESDKRVFKAQPPDPRLNIILHVNNGKKTVDLEISSAVPADTALYYCAIIYGGGISNTEPLIFGKPISLTVNPKDVPVSLPVLSILVPKDGPEMCLAAGFFPREGELTLTLADNNKNENRNVSKAQLSKSKTYYYAAFASGSIKKCEMKGKSASKTSENSSSTASTTDECKTQAEPTTASNQDNDKKDEASSNVVTPKGNMMSVLVTGLRILLAKAVALNVMMTIKTFLV